MKLAEKVIDLHEEDKEKLKAAIEHTKETMEKIKKAAGVDRMSPSAKGYDSYSRYQDMLDNMERRFRGEKKVKKEKKPVKVLSDEDKNKKIAELESKLAAMQDRVDKSESPENKNNDPKITLSRGQAGSLARDMRLLRIKISKLKQS